MQNMKPRTINEWLEWYEQHGGSKDLKLHPEEIIHFHPEHGLITYLIGEDILEIHHMVGDGKYWAKFLKEFAMPFNHITKLNAFTRRNPRAWVRKYGGHIRGYYMEADINEIQV